MMTLKAGIQLGNDKTSVLSLVLLYCFVFCFFNESSLVLCDDLDGYRADECPSENQAECSGEIRA